MIVATGDSGVSSYDPTEAWVMTDNGSPRCHTDRMRRGVVLTGGIGSGKSEVGRLWTSWGAHVVDADRLAREVVEPGSEALSEVLAEFGPHVLALDGSLDRSALAERVFGDPQRLAQLEAIIHPRVELAAKQRLAQGGEAALLVYEVPLPDRVAPFGDQAGEVLVVVVDAPDEVRRARLRTRGLSDAQISARMASQPTREEWLAEADHVIDNEGDRQHLAGQAASLWVTLTGDSPPVAVGGA
jgi:dephospho-CoA kinase